MMCTAVLSVGRTMARKPLLEVLPGHVLLGDEMDTVDAADFVNLHDVRVHERRGRPCLVVKPVDVGLVLGQAPFQDLEGHLSTQRYLLGQIDIGHAAPPQAPQ